MIVRRPTQIRNKQISCPSFFRDILEKISAKNFVFRNNNKDKQSKHQTPPPTNPTELKNSIKEPFESPQFIITYFLKKDNSQSYLF